MLDSKGFLIEATWSAIHSAISRALDQPSLKRGLGTLPILHLISSYLYKAPESFMSKRCMLPNVDFHLTTSGIFSWYHLALPCAFA